MLVVRQLLNPGLPYPVIRLSRLTLTGGTPESSGVAAGGGLEIRGRVDVELTNGTRITGNRSGRGGGVSVQDLAFFRMFDDSEVSSNIATIDGGGIHCADSGIVTIGSGRVSANQAGRDGGGIHAVDCGVGIDALGGAINTLANNIAGTTATAPGQGRGGAVYYLNNGGVVGDNPFSIGLFGGTTLFIGNESRGATTDATVAGAGGGAIYIEGNGPERMPALVNNAIFVNNVAVAPGAGISVARAVDLLVTGQAARCTGTFGFGLCSAFSGQVGSAIAIDDLGVTEPLRAPHVLVERTRFTGTSGAAAVIEDLRSAAGKQIRIRHSLFDANSTTRLLWLRTGTRLQYSTVIGNTFAGTELIRMAPPEGRVFTVELTGSILWQPGRTIVANAGAGTLNIQHSGCLLASSTAGLPAPALILTSPPRWRRTGRHRPSRPRSTSAMTPWRLRRSTPMGRGAPSTSPGGRTSSAPTTSARSSARSDPVRSTRSSRTASSDRTGPRPDSGPWPRAATCRPRDADAALTAAPESGADRGFMTSM